MCPKVRQDTGARDLCLAGQRTPPPARLTRLASLAAYPYVRYDSEGLPKTPEWDTIKGALHKDRASSPAPPPLKVRVPLAALARFLSGRRSPRQDTRDADGPLQEAARRCPARP